MKILLTGSTGYIGRRLKKRLLEDAAIDLRLFVTDRHSLTKEARGRAEVVEGNTFDRKSLERAVEGVHTAYYLIHSMGAGGDFEELDRESARNFLAACLDAGVKRIIYLGGLGVKESASRHLHSRIETGEILSSRPDLIQTLWFRAGIIIGSGSASFEIIRNLVQKLPVMITPRWVRTFTEPVDIGSVLEYLYRAKDLRVEGNRVIDIGSGVMSFRQMLSEAASAMGLRRLMLPVPVFSPKLSSYWLVLFTPVPYRIAAPLVEGLKSETVKQNNAAQELFPGIEPMTFRGSILSAMRDIEQRQVISRWSDATGGPGFFQEADFGMERAMLKYRVNKSVQVIATADVFNAVQAIGGKNGWFRYHILWKIRGIIDKLGGGYGLNRGRRDSSTLRVGDSLDFWKVLTVEQGRRLLLYGEMKMPGKAWLEFIVNEGEFIQTAYFLPKGLAGRIYWYFLYPVHVIIFRDMAGQLLRRARALSVS